MEDRTFLSRLGSSEIEAEALLALLRRGCAEWRSLPRATARLQEWPEFDMAWLAAQQEKGWLSSGLKTLWSGKQLIALADVRVVGQEARVGLIVTDPDYRRQGLASRCLQEALAEAKRQGAHWARTEHFVDSRLTAACAFFERHGFHVRTPEQQNIVFQLDWEAYRPQPVRLPMGFRLASLQPEWLPQWMRTKNLIFASDTDESWFWETFATRWDFEWDGWQTLWHGEELVGLAAADMHRDPAAPHRYCGCQIEYVGVLEAYRGRGLGEMLMQACLQHATGRGQPPCFLITQRFRTAAVALYQKLGFRLLRENRIYEKSLAP